MKTLSRAPGGLALFSACFLFEWVVCTAIRYAAAFAPAWLLLRITHPPLATPGATIVGEIAASIPILMSVAAMAGVPGGGGLIQLRLGARQPSKREWERIDQALAQLDPPAKAPWRTYIIDNPTRRAFVIGQALYLHREILKDPCLAAVIAHELGHIHSIDGRLTLAMQRLAPFPPKRRYAIFGGLSFILARHAFDAYWRHREYIADQYAAERGQGPDLANYLERNQLFDVAVPYQLDCQHPYTEQRIERLQDLDDHLSSIPTGDASRVGYPGDKTIA